MSKNVDLHNADNISILPDMMRRPSLNNSQEEVFSVLKQKGRITLIELRFDYLIPEPAARIDEIWEKGFNVRNVRTIPEYLYKGQHKEKLFKNVAEWQLDEPFWPRPGFLEAKQQKMLEQSTHGEELPALVATAAIPIQVDLFSPQANDAPRTEEAAI